MKPAGEACLSCPAKDAKIVMPEPARGKPRLAIIGEAPGRQELRKGRPFVGSSGRFLDRHLGKIGLRRENVHWTNSVLCEPPVKARELGAARKACAQRLRDEIVTCGAPVIAPVGAHALHSTLKLARKPGITAWRGSVNPTEIEASSGESRGLLVAPTVHPAFVLRSPHWEEVFRIDVQRWKRILEEGFEPPELQKGREIRIAKTREDLRDSLEVLSQSKEIGFDVETVGLGAFETPLVCFGLSDGNLTLVVPWSRGRDGREPWWPFPEEVSKEISRVTSRSIIVTHNGPAFDHVVAGRYGFEISKWEDTLLATHVIASHLKKGLSHVVQLRLDVTAWKEQEDRTADLDRLWIYNARDTLYTILAWKQIKKELEK